MAFAKKNYFIFLIVVLFVFCFGINIVSADEADYDLVVESITVSPEEPALNQNCIITVKIKNNGTKNLYSTLGLTTYNYSFENFIKTKLTAPFPSLGIPVLAGGYLYYTFEGYFIKEGESALSFAVDFNNEMNEGDENNNSVSKTINIVGFGDIDIYVEKIELSEDEPLVNADVTITVTIKNNDSVSLTDSAGLAENDIFISFSGFTIESRLYDNYPTTASPLEPGEEFKYVYSGRFYKYGDSSLSFQADRNNAVIETNENNNATSTVVTVYLTKEERDNFDITDVVLSPISSSSVMVKWKTSKATIGWINYKSSYEFYEKQIAISEFLTEHQATIDNLGKNTTYYYRILAQNDTVTKNTVYYDFITLFDDSLCLSVDLSMYLDNNTALVNWSTNLLSSGYLYYRLKGGGEYKKVGSGDLSQSHEVAVNDLAAGEYEYYIESTSSSGIVYKSEVANFIIESAESDDQGDDGNGDNDDQDNNPAQPDISGETAAKIAIANKNLYNSLKGKIVLKVESNGEAYYINPGSEEMYYLGRPADAFSVMRSRGIGITNNNLEKIQVGLSNLTGNDADNDGLPDMFEDAIGTDKNKKDTDGDGYEDKAELENLYNPRGSGSLNLNNNFSDSQKGKIFLQVENNGEAWYINPVDKKRYFLGRPADAFSVMRNLGLGISNSNFDLL